MNRTPAPSATLGMPVAETLSVNGERLPWRPSDTPGFLVKALFEDPGSGQKTWLMKVEPGAFAPLHAHAELEQVYVLEGSFHDQERSFSRGEYAVRAPGVPHTAGSDTGALLLLVYSRAE